jgi:hypothetical protein
MPEDLYRSETAESANQLNANTTGISASTEREGTCLERPAVADRVCRAS